MTDKWQPIDTAPIDEMVLVCTKQKRIGTATKSIHGWETHGISIYTNKDNSPEYWMPLPEVPKVSK